MIHYHFRRSSLVPCSSTHTLSLTIPQLHRKTITGLINSQSIPSLGPSFLHCINFTLFSHRVAMGGGRKNLMSRREEKHVTLQDGQSIMQVVSLRGSNIIEVMDANGEKSLALFPAKFQKSMWIKRGSFVVVDECGNKNSLESGSKVVCLVAQVLFYEQVRALKKSPEWPEKFKCDLNESTTSQQENEMEMSDDDDGLPPLEANTNRMRPFELHSDENLESNSDTDD